MMQLEDMTKAYRDAMSPEMASAVNLLAHPVAGAAAAGAIGLGLASHAFGMWLGAMAGAAEASQKMLAATMEVETPRPPVRKRGAKLSLVASTPAPKAAVAAARTMIADAGAVAREMAEVASEVAEAVLDDAAAVIAPASRPKRQAAKPAEAPVAAPAVATKPAAIDRPDAPDDLKAIAGIGPKLEKVLNGYGIWTLRQIEALTGPEIAWLDRELGFAGRIGRDDWTGQARALTARA